MTPAFVSVCPKCGYSNDIAATKCAECGASLPGPFGRSPAPLPTKESKSRWGPVIAAVFILIFVVGLGTIGAPVDLTCTRLEWQGPMNCARQTRLFWVIPSAEEHIRDVKGARLVESSGGEDGPTYRVELIITYGGTAPLTSGYTSGSSTKQDVVDKINKFVNVPSPGTLEVTEPGIISLENMGCWLIWLVVYAVGSYVWRGIKGEVRKLRGESEQA